MITVNFIAQKKQNNMVHLWPAKNILSCAVGESPFQNDSIRKQPNALHTFRQWCAFEFDASFKSCPSFITSSFTWKSQLNSRKILRFQRIPCQIPLKIFHQFYNKIYLNEMRYKLNCYSKSNLTIINVNLQFSYYVYLLCLTYVLFRSELKLIRLAESYHIIEIDSL